jgi:hypothetical protein
VNVTILRTCCLLGHFLRSRAYSIGPAIKICTVPNNIDRVIPSIIFSCEAAPGFGVYHGVINQIPVKNRMKAMIDSIASIGRFAMDLKKVIGSIMV